MNKWSVLALLFFLVIFSGGQKAAAPVAPVPAPPQPAPETQAPPAPPPAEITPPAPACTPLDFSSTLALPEIARAKPYRLNASVSFQRGTCEQNASYFIEVFDGDKSLGRMTTPVPSSAARANFTFSYDWNATPGSHTFKAVVTAVGNESNSGNNVVLKTVSVAASQRIAFEDTSGDMEDLVSGTNKRGQQFTVDSKSIITKAYLYLRKSPNAISGGNTNVVFDIRSDDLGRPLQTVLTSAKVSFDSLGGNFTWVEFKFNNSILMPGKYWLLGYEDRATVFYWHKVKGEDKSPYGTETDSVNNAATRLGDASDVWSYNRFSDYTFAVELEAG